MFINFSDIPAHQNLFLDYLSEFENVEHFYKRNFRAIDQYPTLFKLLSEQEREHRSSLPDIIKKQYGQFQISKNTQKNLELLASPKTIAVVTGQQLGIFGGPLYTFYKTITAIKLCSFLKEKFDEYNFVPVFWLEGDDHDYDEVRTFSLLNNENQFVSIKYDDGQLEEINRGSIAGLKFNQNLENVFTELSSSLRETEFKASLLELLKTAYQPGKTFLESFRELMTHIFDEYGLVIFNPVDPAIKKILTPIFYKEISEFNNHTDYLVERSAELEELYHAQVKVKPINLFFVEDNERLLIEPTETGEYRLKGKRKKFTKEEILSIVENSPEKFSSNVLLRPICQDYLFPTGFYIGGPSEVSYFAQVTPLYDLYELHQPFIYPRSSATIVEKGVKAILDKNDLSYQDIFTEEEQLVNKIVSASSEINLETLFDQSLNEIIASMSNIDEVLVQIDKTLIDTSAKTRQRIEESLNNLKSKTLEAQKRKYDSTLRQTGKVRNILYPEGNLQEREINWIYFANKYGPDIISWIFNELAINKFEHQILEM